MKKLLIILLSIPACATAMNKDQGKALLIAIRMENTRIANSLIQDKNTDINTKDEKFLGETPLMVAIAEKLTDIAEALIAKGANVNVQDNGGRTALMWATSDKLSNMVDALIKAHADLNIRDQAGKTALDYSKEQSITQRLERAGAKHGNEI
jgi:ankyrin repeat protein